MSCSSQSQRLHDARLVGSSDRNDFIGPRMLIAEVIFGERLLACSCEAFEWDVRTKYTVHVRYKKGAQFASYSSPKLCKFFAISRESGRCLA